ncbi:glutamate--tRNA ligase family protein [Mucilaginibacter ginkgonis]|uniref:Glutamyl/glutaminyl-tRNA synthetase class Ib catalytic domain-containing protein n=1 Tax=Mucilaginibacter ginkgonis TaxID=2682091 RepID=A0A6I4HWV5_9SPHI|nr:glutamate--tRNA ligase family protein [Mucilaginibacter ginkgonis]QQL51417.1 hypothetical protein GO620_008240 [Mucilaginibacter ginkgonis]
MLYKFTKTRLAPTPSGYLHIGNILSFGITAGLAKKYKAKTLLRIDDLDKVRANPLFVADIFETLNFLSIEWQEGPRHAIDFENHFSQTKRLGLYDQAIEQLKNDGKLFACTCSRTAYSPAACDCRNKHLSFDTSAANWRIISDNCQLLIKQLDSTIIQAELPEGMQNFIVRKKDDYPSYQLASVVDDLHLGVDLIVRGQDLWESTLAQQFLAQQLGRPDFAEIAFYHHPLIKNASGDKLSKSAGDTSVKYLRENGATPAEVFGRICTHAGVNGHAHNWDEFVDLIANHFKL